MRYLPVIILLVLVLITAGCATTKQEVPAPPPATMAVATPPPVPTLTRPLPGVDPIIGSWDNGLVFNADGSVGSDGLVTWKANDMVKNSYFVTTETRAVYDPVSGRRIDPTASSVEWIYSPASDTIHIRDSSAGVRRVLSAKVAATVTPAMT